MLRKPSFGILAEPVSYDDAGHVATVNHHLQTGPQSPNGQRQQTYMNRKCLRGDGEMASSSSFSYLAQDAPSRNDARSPEAREQHHGDELHDQKSHPPSLPSGVASESIRSTNLANSIIWSEAAPDPARTYGDKLEQPTVYGPCAPINESQQSDNANMPGPCSSEISSATTGAIANASLLGPRQNGVIPSIKLSLRGGGGGSSSGEASWAPHKEQKTTFPRFRGRPTTPSHGRSHASSSSPPPHPKPPASAHHNAITPVAAFKHLPKPAQTATHLYLEGALAAHLAVELRMPLTQTFAHLRYAALLLLESESPLLRRTLRSAAEHARFRDGLSPSLLLPDSDFVAGLRAANPRLDQRLRRWRERMRILWALQTVGFPELMRGVEEEKEEEEEGRAKIDASGLGDLDMRL